MGGRHGEEGRTKKADRECSGNEVPRRSGSGFSEAGLEREVLPSRRSWSSRSPCRRRTQHFGTRTSLLRANKDVGSALVYLAADGENGRRRPRGPRRNEGLRQEGRQGRRDFRGRGEHRFPYSLRILAKPRKARVARVGSDSLSLSLSVCLSVHQFPVLNLLPWSDHHAVRGAQAGRDA